MKLRKVKKHKRCTITVTMFVLFNVLKGIWFYNRFYLTLIPALSSIPTIFVISSAVNSL